MTGRRVVEERQSLSRSRLWSLQRTFFVQQGVHAWRTGTVPHYVTSNPAVARAHAQVVFGWLRDVAPTADPSQPVHVVELGAGSGRFGYHFLRAFFALHRGSALRELPVTFVMTDLSRATVDEWRRHPRLQPWVDEGLLQLACYDVEHDDGAGTLTAAGLRNPLAVIANYVFDSLPHDAFTVRDGRLYEELVTLEVGGAGPDPDLDDPAVLAEVSVRYEQSPTTADHYDDPAWNAVLRRYQESLDATTFLFPVGALRSLERLSDLAGGRLMVISADKGYHRLADLDGRGQPHLAVHGSVSMMVNHDAIGQWVEGRGGRFLTLDRRAGALDVCVALLGDAHGDATETRQAYTGAVDEVGPDDLFTLKKAVERAPDGGDWSIAELVAHLRLSGWDARIFLGCFGALLDRVDGASDAEKEELADVARKVWDGYFWIGERQDVPFELGLLCYGIGHLEDAVAFWGHSLDLHGPDPATFLNLATCHREQGEPDKAWLYVNRALDLDPESEPAQALRHALASKEFAS